MYSLLKVLQESAVEKWPQMKLHNILILFWRYVHKLYITVLIELFIDINIQTASTTIDNLLNSSNELAFEQSQNVSMYLLV